MRRWLVFVLVGIFVVNTLVVLASRPSGAGDQVGAPGGMRLREERLLSQYGRERYFGEGFKKPLFWYGLTGASAGRGSPLSSFGRKGFTGGREKFTVSLNRQGRNPGRVSHFDSGYRGYRIMDEIVDLEPYITYTRSNFAEKPPRVKARLFSEQRNEGSGLPKSSVLLQALDLPVLNDYETYEVWLSDEESGYAFSLGFLRSTLRGGVTTSKIGLSGGLGGMLASDGKYDLTLYDTIVVTREPFPDENPLPSGDVVLIGNIPQRKTNEYTREVHEWFK